MKYVLMFALIGVIMVVAQGVCKQYKERCILFEALGEFFRQMQLNLNFQKQKIKEILNQATLKRSNKEIYITYLDYLEKGTTINLNHITLLDNAEQEQVTRMLHSLGKNDTAGELKQLESYEIYLKDKIENARREKEKYCPIITKLSFLFALGLVILFL